MKRYEEYKDSGIDWIGEIPTSWESWKISHAFSRVGSGTTPESGNPIYHENGTINWLNTGDLNEGVLESCSKKITEKALQDYSSLKLFPAGSLVMAMYGATIGKTALINFETTTNQACCVFCESDIIDLKFLQYWFIGEKEHIINLAIGGGQPNISQNILKDLRLFCPKFQEQTQIANYLDYKTAQLDSLINKKEQLIELLKEERTAMINQAVTKGLDATVPMKDSGIEWLGEIPKHWEVSKIKYQFSVQGGGTPSKDNPNYWNGDIPWVSPKDMKKKEIRDSIDKTNGLGISNSSSKIVEANSLLMVVRSGILQRTIPVGINQIPVSLNQDIKSFSAISDLSIQLFYFFIKGWESQLLEDWSKEGATVESIEMEYLMNFPIPIPPKNEQYEIEKFLELSESKIIHAGKLLNQEISLLKEYKTALISEVVTGKVDVRNEIIPQKETSESLT